MKHSFTILFILVCLFSISAKGITEQRAKQKNELYSSSIHAKSGMHQLWNELLQKHVTKDGLVNYKTFKLDHDKLLKYISVLSTCRAHENFNLLSREKKIAFWINAYNALTIDLILKYYPIKSIKDIQNPWGQRLWEMGNKIYSLEEIEHHILRKMNEPRIHFAIVCASFSCPKLQNIAFTSTDLELQLTHASKQFLRDRTRNEISKNSIKISKIFKWFLKDFTGNESLIDFLNRYTEIQISPNAKKQYKDYNWTLNE